MTYVLETPEEFERLERQSLHPNYDFQIELQGIDLLSDKLVLDAGCGSGILTRFLARTNPQIEFVGVDLSNERITGAQQASSHLSNVDFKVSSLENTPFSENHFDTIICRYVVQHLTDFTRPQVIKELFRILKPGGKLVLIDTDGLIANLWPVPASIENMFATVILQSPVDLFVGRKLPGLLAQLGWAEVNWKIQTTECHGSSEADKSEILMMKERLTFAAPALAKILGSNDLATTFIESYTLAMSTPGAVYFQNKFIVTAQKPKQNFLKLVETNNDPK